MKSLLIAILLLAVAECHLDFDYSVLYDMNDFKGTPNYPIRICAPGCRVYLTYLDDPQHLGDQDNGPITIMIGDQTLTTLYDLNRLQGANGEKGFLNIPMRLLSNNLQGTAEFIVHNPHGNLVARPLALWVVPNTTPMLNALAVFEATAAGKITATAGKVVLMSVAPFTANAQIDGDYHLTVKTSPFEMLSNEKCQHVLKTFSLPFNSPLVSFGFDSAQGYKMTLNTNFDFPIERSIDAPGYLASPGYIGCTNATFRSESYNYGITSFNETFLVDGATRRHVSFYGDLDTDGAAPILLYDMDTDKEPMSITGLHADNTNIWKYQMDTSSFSIHWDSGLWRNESFMIRYEVTSTVLPSGSTVTSPTVDLTTSNTALRSMVLAVLLVTLALVL